MFIILFLLFKVDIYIYNVFSRAGVGGSSDQMKELIIKTSEAANVEIHGGKYC